MSADWTVTVAPALYPTLQCVGIRQLYTGDNNLNATAYVQWRQVGDALCSPEVEAAFVRRLAPTFFGGYETLQESGVRLATPEKALIDTLYLGPTRSRMFAHLPEIEISKGFDRRKAQEWIARIPVGPRRTSVERRLVRVLGPHRRQERPVRQDRRTQDR